MKRPNIFLIVIFITAGCFLSFVVVGLMEPSPKKGSSLGRLTKKSNEKDRCPSQLQHKLQHRNTRNMKK
jgi:hypothetical protein